MKRAVVVFGMFFAVALVIVGAADILQSRAEVIEFGFADACQEACYMQYFLDLDACSILRGHERSMCRRTAQAASRACVQGCLL